MAVSVTGVAIINSKKVKVTFTGALYNTTYKCTVSNVQSQEGAVIDPSHDDGNFTIPPYDWTLKSPVAGTTPAARHSAVMTFDSSRNLVMIQGGVTSAGLPGAGVHATTYKYDYTTNTCTSLANHLGRYYHGMAYRSATDRIIWYDGNDGVGTLGTTTYSYNPGTNVWSLLSPAINPGQRMAYAMCYDANRDRIVLFGGCNNNNSVKYDTVYEYDGSNWANRTPVGTKPTARSFMKMVYDSAIQKCILFGGNVAAGYNNETWTWDGTTWVQLSPTTSPGNRGIYAMAYNSARDKTIIYGGYNGGSYINETWEFDYSENTWTQIYPPTDLGNRAYFNITYDSNSGKPIAFGGYATGPTNYNDFWAYI